MLKLNLTFRAGITQEIGPGTGGIATGSVQEVRDTLSGRKSRECNSKMYERLAKKNITVKETLDKEVMRQMWEYYKEGKDRTKEG